MKELTNQEVVERCIESCASLKRHALESAQWLWLVDKDRLWAGRADSWSEFVEVDCDMKKSFADKLKLVWQHFIIEQGATLEQLKNQDGKYVDVEKLYLGRNITKPIEEKLEIIKGNSRKDINNLIKNDGEECTHDYEIIQICSHCRARI